MEKTPKVVSISILGGSPHADIPDAGFGTYVVPDDDQALADRLADQLAATAWTYRHEFVHTALPVREAVAKALAAEGKPIVLAHMADNTGGRAAGGRPQDPPELPPGGAPPAVVACLLSP